jgi:8-oxo-dGTP diphosphatase
VERLEVVGAVIVEAGRVFCTQRGTGPLAGLWEFPGGKVEPGETAREALAREIREELGCSIDAGQEVARTTYRYPFGDVTLTTFLCTIRTGSPRLSEHTDARWLLPDELTSLDWAPADLPAVEHLQRLLGTRRTDQP